LGWTARVPLTKAIALCWITATLNATAVRLYTAAWAAGSSVAVVSRRADLISSTATEARRQITALSREAALAAATQSADPLRSTVSFLRAVSILTARSPYRSTEPRSQITDLTWAAPWATTWTTLPRIAVAPLFTELIHQTAAAPSPLNGAPPLPTAVWINSTTQAAEVGDAILILGATLVGSTAA